MFISGVQSAAVNVICELGKIAIINKKDKINN